MTVASANKNRIRLRILREKWKSAGLCINCGKDNDRKERFVTCSKCSEAARVSYYRKKGREIKSEPIKRVYDSNEHRKKIVRESRRKIRATRIALGLCVECGLPNDRDKQTCSACGKKATDIVRRRNERLRNEG